METNAVDLQAYVDSVSATTPEHISGMLGLGLFGSCVALMILFYLIMVVIGIIHQRKENKRWLVPNKEYIMEIGRGIGIHYKTIMGIPCPRAFVSRSDAYYYKPTPAEFDEAAAAVRKDMRDNNWTLDEYSKRQNDCEDFAMKMACEIRKYITDKWGSKIGAKGVAVGFIGYVIDHGKNKGVGHVDVIAYLNNGEKRVQWPYPAEKYAEPKTLSVKEWKSVNLNIL